MDIGREGRQFLAESKTRVLTKEEWVLKGIYSDNAVTPKKDPLSLLSLNLMGRSLREWNLFCKLYVMETFFDRVDYLIREYTIIRNKHTTNHRR